jgi:hypothetical protein
MSAKKLSVRLAWKNVTAEISAVIDRHGNQPDLGVLAMLVINNHPEVKGKDADFHVCAAFRAVRKEISDQLNQRRFRPSIHQQEFEALKHGYNVDRDGQQLHLDLELLSFDEIMSKSEEYRKQGQAQIREADELRRYAFAKFPTEGARYLASEVTADR